MERTNRALASRIRDTTVGRLNALSSTIAHRVGSEVGEIVRRKVGKMATRSAVDNKGKILKTSFEERLFRCRSAGLSGRKWTLGR